MISSIFDRFIDLRFGVLIFFCLFTCFDGFFESFPFFVYLSFITQPISQLIDYYMYIYISIYLFIYFF